MIRLQGAVTAEDALPGEAAWRWQVQLRVERVVSPARAVVVALTTAAWLWLPHPASARPLPAGALLAAAWLYLAADHALLWHRPDLAERCPWGSAALDFLFIGAWLWASGGRGSPYLPLVFLGAATAPLRLRAAFGVALSLGYAGLSGWGPGGPLGPAYVAVLGLLQTALNALTYRDRRSDLRDGLTGLLARGYALFRIERLLREGAYPFSVALIDLDGFKTVNDTYGHAAGDMVLREASRLIPALVRPDDLVARFGGDEFLVVWPDTAAEAAAQAAERIRAALAQTGFHLRERQAVACVTMSAGVAQASPGCTVAELLRAADECLYKAKAGRDRVVLATGSAC